MGKLFGTFGVTLALCVVNIASAYTKEQWSLIENTAKGRNRAERIATFDFDGTVISQRPSYAVVEYFIYESDVTHYISAPAGSGLSSAADYQFGQLAPDLTKMIRYQINAFAGRPVEEVKERAFQFLNEHYRDRVFSEQKRLVSLLHDMGYAVYLVSGSNKMFLEKFAKATFGIPAKRIIATAADVAERDIYPADWAGNVVDGEEKVVEIKTHIPVVPLIAVGNSAGDLPMLRLAKVLAIMTNPDEKAGKGFVELKNAQEPSGKQFIEVRLSDDEGGLNRVASYNK